MQGHQGRCILVADDPTKFYTNEFVKEANNYDQTAIVAQAKSWKE